MEEQLYNSLVAEYSVGVASKEEFVPSEDVEGIVKVLNGKVDSTLKAEDVEIEANFDGSYDVKIGGYEDESLSNSGVLTYSTNNQRCVTHGNKLVGEEPPEGPAKDGKGDNVFGIR